MKYDVYINDTIGWPISAAYVRRQIENAGDKHLDVYISSLGGDVAEALQIRQMFVEHGDVTAHLHGFVASAATIISTGAKDVRIGKYAMYMIHKCSSWQEEWGTMNADQIQEVIERLTKSQNTLDQIDQVLAAIYADRTGLTIAEISDMMKEETWMNATEAFDKGFVDTVTDDEPMQLTDELRGRIAACGYPQPHMQTAEASESFWTKMRKMLDEVFTIKPLYESNTENMNEEIKKQEQPPQAAAKEQPVQTVDTQEVTVTVETQEVTVEAPAQVEDVAQVDNELESLRAALEDMRKERDALKAQVEVLQSADGADTNQVVSEGEAENPREHVSRARKAYDNLRTLLN